MGLEVLQWDVVVNSPGYARPSKGMEAINGWVQLEGNQEMGKGGADHGRRDRKRARRGGDKK